MLILKIRPRVLYYCPDLAMPRVVSFSLVQAEMWPEGEITLILCMLLFIHTVYRGSCHISDEDTSAFGESEVYLLFTGITRFAHKLLNHRQVFINNGGFAKYTM